MKFNIYNDTKVNGEQITNNKIEIEMSAEELRDSYKHIIDLLEHKYEICDLIKNISDIATSTIEKLKPTNLQMDPTLLTQMQQELKENKEVA